MSSQQKKMFRMSLSSNLQAQESEKQNNSYLKLSRANLMASNLDNFDNVSIIDDNISEISFKDSVTSRSVPRQNNMVLFKNTQQIKSNTPSEISRQFDNESIASSQVNYMNDNLISDNIPSDIKKFLLSFQNTKQDNMYRRKYNIPKDFDVYYYLLRYPQIGNIRQFNFKRIVSLYRFFEEKAKIKYSLDDKYYRLKYWIPDNFECNLYKKRYPELFEKNIVADDNNSIYEYFYENGKDKYTLDLDYHRIYLKIDKYFDIKTLVKRYPELNDFDLTFNQDDEIECFTFYDSIDRDKFTMDDKYYRIHFKIPDAFTQSIYYERYNNVKEIIELQNKPSYDLYHYFTNIGQYSNSLDENYYILKYDIPSNFDCFIYSNRYKENMENVSGFKAIIEFYHANKKNYPLDEKYFQMKYNTNSDFDWEKYSETYASKIHDKSKLNDMSYIYYLYHTKFHDNYDRSMYVQYLVLKNDLSTVNLDLFCKLHLSMYKYIPTKDFIYNICNDQIKYENIYGKHMSDVEKVDEEFITRMSFLLRKGQNFVKTEKEVRRYIYAYDFLNSIYYQNFPIVTTRKRKVIVTAYHEYNETRYNIVTKPKSKVTEFDIVMDSNYVKPVLQEKQNIPQEKESEIKKETHTKTVTKIPNLSGLANLNLNISDLRKAKERKINSEENKPKIIETTVSSVLDKISNLPEGTKMEDMMNIARETLSNNKNNEIQENSETQQTQSEQQTQETQNEEWVESKSKKRRYKKKNKSNKNK